MSQVDNGELHGMMGSRQFFPYRAHHNGGINENLMIYPNTVPDLPFYQPSNFNQHLQSQFSGPPPHPQWQAHILNALQQRGVYCPTFPPNSLLYPSNTTMLIDSSLRTAQASAVDAPAACGSAASLGRREQQHVQQQGRSVNEGSEYTTYYSEELKREFCVFKRNWISARTEGHRSETWRRAHLAFFRSHHNFRKGFIPNERTTRNWWSQRHRYLTDVGVCEESSTCREPGRYGGGSCRDSGGNVGIGSENNDSAGGGCTGCDDRMVDSHRSDAEHGGAFTDTSAADADEADAAHHHLAQVQTVQASSFRLPLLSSCLSYTSRPLIPPPSPPRSPPLPLYNQISPYPYLHLASLPHTVAPVSLRPPFSPRPSQPLSPFVLPSLPPSVPRPL
jgi:hypothetical protein